MQPLYQRILNNHWDSLPPPIRGMHDIAVSGHAEGVADVTRGRNPLGHLACFILGMPQAGKDLPVSVSFIVESGVETWTRNFAGQSFSSLQSEGTGSWRGLVVERFGPLAFGFALESQDGKLLLHLRKWSLFGVPLPMFLCARSDSYEFVEDGKFHFNVRISHPLTGLIIHYRGWLLRKA